MAHTHTYTHLLLSSALHFVHVNVALKHTLQGVTDYMCSYRIISRTDVTITGESDHIESSGITHEMTKVGSDAACTVICRITGNLSYQINVVEENKYFVEVEV